MFQTFDYLKSLWGFVDDYFFTVDAIVYDF